MGDKATDGPTQKTQPKGKDKRGRRHKPIDIPVPKREDIERLLTKAAKGGGPQKSP